MACSTSSSEQKKFPVKSLPSASIGEKFIKNNYNYLNAFKEVIYAGELDEAGRRAAERIYESLPEKFYYVPMSKYKDANEFLEADDIEPLYWAAQKPQRYSPENFFSSDINTKMIRSHSSVGSRLHLFHM